jgi:hypothetical protein
MKYKLILQIAVFIGFIIICSNCSAQQISNEKTGATTNTVSDSMKINNTQQQTTVPELSNTKAKNENSNTEIIKDNQTNTTDTKGNINESNTGVISSKKKSNLQTTPQK